MTPRRAPDDTTAHASSTDETAPPTGLSRRGLLGLAGAGVLGAGIGFASDRAIATAAEWGAVTGKSGAAATYPFFAEHQSGLITAAQDRLHFASFDVADISWEELVELLEDCIYAASRLTQGEPVGPGGPGGGDYDAPPGDTREALDLPLAGLTTSFGFGPTLFTDAAGRDRFDIAGKRPTEFIDLPKFPGDQLIAQLTGGDLCIQACSDDPQIAVHAIRNLSRIAFGRASLRWSQLGYGRTSSTTRGQVTPRNLMGFKDGTANLKAEDTAQVNAHVWASGSDSQSWMTNGSYLVARKIRMTIETWDRASLREQERVIGRDKGEGAPLSGGTEFTQVDLEKKNSDGVPFVDAASHVRLAHPRSNDGAVMLRRGYNFVDGNDVLGRLNAGPFFISFQRNPATQFVPVQMQLAENDSLGEYLRHLGSGIFAVPPGAPEGGFVGQTLFA